MVRISPSREGRRKPSTSAITGKNLTLILDLWLPGTLEPTHLMPDAGRGPGLAPFSQDTGVLPGQRVENFPHSRIGVAGGGVYGLSNFWSHYKTLLLIRIEYHLQSSLHKPASQAKKIKNKGTPEEKKNTAISLPSKPIYI